MDEKWARRISELTRENAAIRREWATAVGERGPGDPAKVHASDVLLDRFNANVRRLDLAMRQATSADLRQADEISEHEDRIRRTEKSGPSTSPRAYQGDRPGPGKHRGPDLDSPSAR